MLADTVLLETESWAHKALLLKGWPDDRELQTRCMLACLLFGAERGLRVPEGERGPQVAQVGVSRDADPS